MSEGVHAGGTWYKGGLLFVSESSASSFRENVVDAWVSLLFVFGALLLLLLLGRSASSSRENVVDDDACAGVLPLLVWGSEACCAAG